jgi:hypothetical protein
MVRAGVLKLKDHRFHKQTKGVIFMRRLFIIGGFIIVAGLLITQVLLNSIGLSYASLGLGSSTQLMTSPSPIPLATPADTIGEPISSPAVGVHAITGAVTEASVRAYISDVRHQAAATYGQNVRVKEVRFLQHSELKGLLGTDPLSDSPASQQLVYVTLTGDFQDDTPVMHTGYVIFDARTGNLLVSDAK